MLLTKLLNALGDSNSVAKFIVPDWGDKGDSIRTNCTGQTELEFLINLR
jgi:hypothetical protein